MYTRNASLAIRPTIPISKLLYAHDDKVTDKKAKLISRPGLPGQNVFRKATTFSLVYRYLTGR